MNRPVRAKKSLGQNFLVDVNYQRKIVTAIDPQPIDEIVEIGPGTGALTQHLAGKVRRYVGIELDDELAQRLISEYRQYPGFQLLHQNVLAVDFAKLTEDCAQLKIVGNIPYNITSTLLFKVLERNCRASVIVLMVQREVADRITAMPGGKEYGALTVGVQSVARAERLFIVPRGAFRPAPNIDSAVVRIVPRRPPELSATDESDLRTLTRTAFSWRRKQLQRILRSAAEYALAPQQLEKVVERAEVAGSARPEELSPSQFIQLARALRSMGYPKPEASK